MTSLPASDGNRTENKLIVTVAQVDTACSAHSSVDVMEDSWCSRERERERESAQGMNNGNDTVTQQWRGTTTRRYRPDCESVRIITECSKLNVYWQAIFFFTMQVSLIVHTHRKVVIIVGHPVPRSIANLTAVRRAVQKLPYPALRRCQSWMCRRYSGGRRGRRRGWRCRR